MAEALFRALGKDQVRENRAFFEQAAREGDSARFDEALHDFLGD
jgi:hypothetical protein